MLLKNVGIKINTKIFPIFCNENIIHYGNAYYLDWNHELKKLYQIIFKDYIPIPKNHRPNTARKYNLKNIWQLADILLYC